MKLSYQGVIVGSHIYKGRTGAHWPTDHNKWGGSKALVSRIERLNLKYIFFYTYKAIRRSDQAFNPDLDVLEQDMDQEMLAMLGRIYGWGHIRCILHDYNPSWHLVEIDRFRPFRRYVALDQIEPLEIRSGNTR